jgi:hypothetical protein
MAGDGAVEAARDEEGDYEWMEDFAKSSEGMITEATQVNSPPVNATMTSLARELQCNDNNGWWRTRRRHNGMGTTIERAHCYQLESCGLLLLDPLVSPMQSLSAANQGLMSMSLPMTQRVSPKDDKAFNRWESRIVWGDDWAQIG